MSAIAIQLPEEVTAARDGILAFAEQEVIPRHEANRALFENPRALYREDGRFSDALLALPWVNLPYEDKAARVRFCWVTDTLVV